MNKFFITATGTGVGKTYVTTAICRQLIRKGIKVTAFKPVISGYDTDDAHSDTALILKSCGLVASPENIDAISPWRFKLPLSPDMAAKKEGVSINLDQLIDFCRSKEKGEDQILLVEGVGGVCVPLNEQFTVTDWIAGLYGWKVIMVAGSYLGSISHTLTAVQALKIKNIEISAIIVSESENSNVLLADTLNTLRNFIPENIPIISIPRYTGNDIIEIPEINRIFYEAQKFK